MTKIIPRVPPVYRLRDHADDEIEGVFYAKELQKVHKSDDIYKIEKILAEKKENGKVKVLVKWLRYAKKLKVLYERWSLNFMFRFQVIASMQYFPDNKTSNFVTKLSRTL